MSDSRRVVRPVFSILLITATALGLMNVFSDNADVKLLAKDTACVGSKNCTAQMTQMSRNPFTQGFTFQTNSNASSSIHVSCHRTYYLLGPYQCARSAE